MCWCLFYYLIAKHNISPNPEGIMLRMRDRLLESWYGLIYPWLARAGQHLMQIGRTCDSCGWASRAWARSAGQRVRGSEGSHLWSESRVSKSSVVCSVDTNLSFFSLILFHPAAREEQYLGQTIELLTQSNQVNSWDHTIHIGPSGRLRFHRQGKLRHETRPWAGPE